MYDMNSEAATLLCRALLALESEDECRAFLLDICSIREIQDMSQRIVAADMLKRGMSYQKITEQLGISAATLSRINRCLVYGEGGYKTVLERIEAPERKEGVENEP